MGRHGVACCVVMSLFACIDANLQVAHGHYIDNGIDYGKQCATRCSDGYQKHEVSHTETIPVLEICPPELSYDCTVKNIARTIEWDAFECVKCVTAYDLATNQPLTATQHEYDRHCNLTCIEPWVFRESHPGKCVKCDKQCEHGEYLTGPDCQTCGSCQTQKHGSNWEFVTEGQLDDPLSCVEQCESGYFADTIAVDGQIQYICREHSQITCEDGSILFLGTPHRDARCEKCLTECEGFNMTEECNPETKQQMKCTECDLILKEGQRFVGSHCQTQCVENRFFNQQTLECDICYHTCFAGSHFTDTRQDCYDCTECSSQPETSKPNGAVYVNECEWECEDGFQFNTSSSACDPIPSVVTESTPYQWPTFKCQNSQKWTLLGCQDCPTTHTPYDGHGEKWDWKPSRSSCEWECMPGFYSFSIDSSAGHTFCYTFEEYLSQIQTSEVVINTVSDSKWSVHKHTRVPFLSEWSLGMASVLVIFTTVYAFH